MASRSTLVKLQNETSDELSLIDARLSHGIWTNNQYPPETIKANGSGTWQSESDGFLTGTEGSVQYHMAAGVVMIGWDNPYAGSNSYTQSAPKGYAINHQGGSGDNADVTFTLTKAK